VPKEPHALVRFSVDQEYLIVFTKDLQEFDESKYLRVRHELSDVKVKAPYKREMLDAEVVRVSGNNTI
jgi:hypothetical protein